MFALTVFLVVLFIGSMVYIRNIKKSRASADLDSITYRGRTYNVVEGLARAFSYKLVSIWSIKSKDELTQFELYHELTHARYWHVEILTLIQAGGYAIIAGAIAGEIPVITILWYSVLVYIVRIGMEFQADYGGWKASKASSKVIDYLVLMPEDREYNDSWKAVLIDGYPKFKWRKAMLNYYNSKLS